MSKSNGSGSGKSANFNDMTPADVAGLIVATGLTAAAGHEFVNVANIEQDGTPLGVAVFVRGWILEDGRVLPLTANTAEENGGQND